MNRDLNCNSTFIEYYAWDRCWQIISLTFCQLSKTPFHTFANLIFSLSIRVDFSFNNILNQATNHVSYVQYLQFN